MNSHTGTYARREIPKPYNVYAIHRLFRTQEELVMLYGENEGKYKNLKDALLEDIEKLVAPMRARRESVSDADVVKILKKGNEQARERASQKMADVRKKIGIAL